MRTNLLKSINVIRRGSGANLNLFRSATMVLVLLFTLGITNAWGGDSHSTHTATLNVAKGTGSGTVYASTSGSATSGSASASFNCGGDEGGQHTGTLYAYATPASGYTFLGWTTSASSSAGADNSNPKGVAFNVTDGNNTQTLYAHFVEKAKVNITFVAPSNGTYTIAVNGGSAETVSSANVVKNNVESVTLTATPASGYAFAGWYKLNSAGEFVEDLSIASPYNASFTTSETIKMGARFVPTTLGKFILKGSDTQYYGLKAATIAAGGSGTIVPVADETVVDGSDLMPFDNGSYILKAKLLIPYESGNTWQTLPKVVKSAATLSPYKKLILMDGVNIVVNSGAQICIGGQAMAGSGGSPSGYTTGACGVLDMSRGGHLELNNGSTLYCWGFVKGQDMDQGNNTVGVGTITVNSGATVWEPFSVGDWRGGSATSSIVNTRFFPFQSYFMQNIEVPTTFWHGSSEWCYFTLNATGGPYDTQFAVIGSSNCLFKLTDAQSKVRTWYDPTTDLMCYELSGSAILDELKIKITGLPLIGTIDINSSQFDLPITSNMHLILADCTMNLTKPLIIQPGAIIEIKNSATVTLSTNLYMYDKDDWGPWVCGKYFKATSNLTTHKNRGDGSSNSLMDDAKFIIDGSFTIGSSGKLYSTAGGAALVGNGGGTLAYPSSLSGSSTLKWYKSTTTSGDGETGTVAVNNANPCNEDESYTKSIASTTFYNVHGRWFKSGNQNENADHTYNFTYIASGAVSGTGGTDVSPNTHNAVYAPDKTGLAAGMKWCNVVQDATCNNIFNATQALNETPASDIRYTYPSDSWLQLLRTETEGVYGGSDNSLYAVEGCAVNSLGSVDENCLYTINDVKKALVDGHFVALEKNTEDEAWHDVANPTNYYISFAGCTWHPATKEIEEKAYTVEGGIYIWYNNDWLLVEREDPFFFDYNDQNVKRYYEYENGAWGLAEPRVRVVDAIETRDFYFINEAFTVANGKKNTTITLLKDIPTITAGLTYSAKNTTCTLDLNGHILPGSISSMLKIDASGSTFTITDNSEGKLGRIQLTVDDNARRYCVNLTSGSLILNAGTISAINTMAYNSSTAKTTQSCGLIVKPGMTFTMDGGRIEAFAAYNPWGIYVEGSTTSGGTITINGGTVHSETTQISSPYGIYGYGTWNINSGATIEAVAQTTSACALYVEATTSKYFGTLNLKGGTINATSTTTTATGVFVNGVYIMAKTTPNTISETYRAVANITGGTINAITNGTTTAYGIQSRGTTTIANATVNVTPKTTTGYAFFVQDGTTTINSGTFNVNATTTAKGIYANGATPDDKTGRPYNPNVIVNGGVFNVTATTSTPSYGIHMDCNIRNITSTASGYYPGIYSSVPTVTVNGGEFYVRSTTKEAWGAYVGRNYRFETGTNTVAEWYRPTLTINDGKFEVTTGSGANAEAIRTYGITHVNGGNFTATAETTYAYGFRVMDGIGTTSNNPKFTVKATTTSAFGAVADVSQPADKTGVPCQGDLTIGGGTFDVDAVTSDAYGLYVNASGRVITSTADGYYPGDYSSIGRATVNSGTFNVTTTTLNAIGAYVKRDVQANRFVNYGELTINDGDFTVATSVQTKGKNCIGVWTYGTTTINGGTFDVTAANSTTAANGYYAFGVYALDGNTIINNSPEFTVKAYVSAYGVYANADQANATTGLTYNSNVTVNGGTYNVSTTGTTSAIGAIVSVPAVRVIASGDYAGDYYSSATLTINDGTFNVESATTTATGAYAGRNYVSANTMPNTFSKYNYGNLIIHGGTFNVSTNSETGTTTADGVKSHGTTLVDGGTFNVTPKTTTAFGVRVYAGKTTINETAEHSPEFNVTATTTAYGVMAGGGEAPNSSTGLCYDGEVEVNAGTFNVETTSDKPAYGVYVYVGTRKITSTSSGYYRGNYAYAGIATINGGEFNVTSKKTEAYGIFVPAGATQSGATAYDPASATPECTVNGGKFWITGTSAIYMTNTKALTDNYKIYGGYYGGALNADYGLSKYAVSPKQVITLNDQNANYPKYTYKVGDGATITWKNGSTTLTSTPNLFELEVTPVYYGTEPTKDADAQYTYTFDGWSTADGGDKLASLPAVSADATYFAHYSKTERKYTVNVSAGEHGSVSPASVSEIGCETASGDITATPDAGYSFNGWTLPEGVTAADGYTVTSNPIRIHAIAADKTITANFVARTDINYTVKHWQQNIENDEYTEVTADQETKQGTTATATVATAKSYTGFTAQPITQETIAGNGSTIVNIYYNRNTFTITWLDGNGNAVETDENVKYGATPEYNGETPTKTATAQYTYTFNNTWSPAIVAVEGAATYTAQFNSIANTYTIIWKNGDDVLETDENVTYGTTPSYDGATPVSPDESVQYTYPFTGWTPSVVSVTKNATYTATFGPAETKMYPVVWKDWNGTTLREKSKGWGWQIPEYDGATPTRAQDGNKVYTFAGWSEPVSEVENGDLTYTARYALSIDVQESQEVTEISIAEDEEVKITTVEVKGKLNVKENKTLTTDDLILEGTPSSSGEITGEGTVTATRAYFDFSNGTNGFKAKTWYAVAVPWEVEVPAGGLGGVYLKKGEGDYVQQRLGKTYDLIYYDGARRATGVNKAWNYVEDDAAAKQIMYPGRAYMIYLTSDADMIRFERKDGADLLITEIEAHTYGDDNTPTTLANWNGIANPATYHAYLNVGATDGRGQVYNPDTKQYNLFKMNENKLVVGQPIFVQSAVDGTVVANSTTYSPSLAPRRSKAWSAPLTRYELMLAASEADVTDRVIVRMDEDKEEDAYIVGQDLAKMGVSSVVPQMWIDRYDSKMCINTVAGFNHTADYPLGIFAPKDGEYNLFMDDQPNDETMLYLTYDGEAIWNLSYGGYVTYLTKGTDTHYGLRIVAHKPQTPTGIEETTIQNGDPIRKVMVDGKVYIIRNGEIYSVTGQKTK